MSKRIILTGGSGFIGRHIAAGLLRENHEVFFLMRPLQEIPARDRILRALSPFYLPDIKPYHIIEEDLSSRPGPKLCGIDEVWHCAASLSFKENDRKETFLANVGGTRSLLEWMGQIGVRRLHYLSTAYVSGNRHGLIKEGELDCGQAFYNPYEESKMQAEKLVYRWSAETGGRYTIYRPSVIVGDSTTGYAVTPQGYYACLKPFQTIKQNLEDNLKKNPRLFKNTGIRIFDERVHLPLSFPGKPETLVNLLPIDKAVKTIFKCSHAYGTFHITNAHPLPLKQVLEMSMASLGITGVTISTNNSISHPLLTHLNNELKRSLKYFLPYTMYGSKSATFEQTNTISVLNKPLSFEITVPFLRSILDFAYRTMPSLKNGKRLIDIPKLESELP
ncbi:MAG: SDR family oxidoreductase [Nitrospiria bacterium]